jgi:hypothetical protein
LEKDFRFWLRRGGILLLMLCALGCQRWRLPNEFGYSEESASATSATADSISADPTSAAVPQPVAKPEAYGWYESKEALDGRYYWRCDLLEEIGQQVSGEAELRGLISSGSVEASTSATIQLARIKPGSRDVELERIAGAKSQQKTTRLAAIETLGESPNETASERLKRIAVRLQGALSNYSYGQESDDDRYLAASLRALASRGDDLSAFHACLSAHAPPLTCLALIEAQTEKNTSPSSSNATACFAHPASTVRIAMLDWIANSQDQQAIDEVLATTRGAEGELTFAAIRTLGALPGAVSKSRLEELTRDRQPRIRGAALAALIRQDSSSAISSALAETQWQVKRAIAEFLVEPASAAQWRYVEALLIDPAPAVGQSLTRTVATWSFEGQKRAAVFGLESPQLAIRQSSWKWIKDHCASNTDFNPAADKDARAIAATQIRESLQLNTFESPKSYAGSTPSLQSIRSAIADWQSEDFAKQGIAELKLLGLGAGLSGALDELSPEEIRRLPAKFWTQVAAVADSRLASAIDLRDAEVVKRREAASKLAERMNRSPPSLCLLIWLDTLLAPEEDPLVWRRVLEIARRASGETAKGAAAELASRALGMEALDVRMSACEIIEVAPAKSDYLAALEPLLDSDSELERIAAIRAIGRQGELPLAVRDKLSTFMTAEAGATRIEAAFILATQGDVAGADKLTNAAMLGIETERRLAVERLGETGEASHVPLLIGLLDASPTLRQAAIESLDKLVAEEVVAQERKLLLSSTEIASMWKSWYAERETGLSGGAESSSRARKNSTR